MRWRAVVMIRLGFPNPPSPDVLRRELQEFRQMLFEPGGSVRIRRVKLQPSPRFVRLTIDGRTAKLDDVATVLSRLLRHVRADLGASSADIVLWAAHRRGPAGLRQRTGVRLAASGPGGPRGGGGSGTAGVREPRRPHPPGFPPMTAAIDPVAPDW